MHRCRKGTFHLWREPQNQWRWWCKTLCQAKCMRTQGQWCKSCSAKARSLEPWCLRQQKQTIPLSERAQFTFCICSLQLVQLVVPGSALPNPVSPIHKSPHEHTQNDAFPLFLEFIIPNMVQSLTHVQPKMHWLLPNKSAFHDFSVGFFPQWELFITIQNFEFLILRTLIFQGCDFPDFRP